MYDKGAGADDGYTIASFDPSEGENAQPDVFYKTDGTDKDNDGAIGSWLAVANDRVYFQSKGFTGSVGMGASQTKQQKYDCGTPWSVSTDGSDSRRGSKYRKRHVSLALRSSELMKSQSTAGM